MPDTDATTLNSSIDDDDKELVALGYVPSFKREFSNLATVSTVLSVAVWLVDAGFRSASPLASWYVETLLGYHNIHRP
jgi:hypothetical protein